MAFHDPRGDGIDPAEVERFVFFGTAVTLSDVAEEAIKSRMRNEQAAFFRLRYI